MAKYFKFRKDQVFKKEYNNNRIALVIIDTDDEFFGKIATATVNLPDEDLLPDEVFIKNWSENEGVLADLIAFKVVSSPIDEIETGFCTAYKCKLLI